MLVHVFMLELSITCVSGAFAGIAVQPPVLEDMFIRFIVCCIVLVHVFMSELLITCVSVAFAGIAVQPPVLERYVHSVYCAEPFVSSCQCFVCTYFPFGVESGI